MYNLHEVFSQALKDKGSVCMSVKGGTAIINNGCKIQQMGDCIQILDMGSEYYKEFTDDQYQIMLENGWKDGCYLLTIENCKAKLDLIEQSIREEVNSRKNDKHIRHLKARRENILKRFTKIKSKLNGKEHV
jgi:hypothetical protein